MKCPLCRKETYWSDPEGNDNPWRPFCSERCQLIDLGRWATEEYRFVQEEQYSTTEESPADPNEDETAYVN